MATEDFVQDGVAKSRKGNAQFADGVEALLSSSKKFVSHTSPFSMPINSGSGSLFHARAELGGCSRHMIYQPVSQLDVGLLC